MTKEQLSERAAKAARARWNKKQESSERQFKQPRLDTLTELPAGVYLLWCSGKVVYVGEAQNIFRRIWTHFQEGKKFTSATWELIPGEAERRKREAELIGELKPRYNTQLVGSR